MINALSLTLKLSNLLLLLPFSTRKVTSEASLAILSNFFENSELTTTHYIFRDCRAHLFRLTFFKTAVSNEEIITGRKFDVLN